MEEQINKAEQDISLLDARLKSLRSTIKGKTNNVRDLEEVLEQERDRLKSFPIYCYILLIIHFTLMLAGWTSGRGVMFTMNFVMYHWYVKKFYREIITMRIAVPLSLFVMLIWAIN